MTSSILRQRMSRCAFTTPTLIAINVAYRVLVFFKQDKKNHSHVQICATLWTAACQAHLSMRFSRQECWSGLPCPSPGDLPDPGIKPTSLIPPALAGRHCLGCKNHKSSAHSGRGNNCCWFHISLFISLYFTKKLKSFTTSRVIKSTQES